MNFNIPILSIFNKAEKTDSPLPSQYALKEKALPKFEADIETLDQAIAQTKDDYNADRITLQSLYENFNDLHLNSQIRTAGYKILSEKWAIVDDKGNEKDELTALLKKEWFHTLNMNILLEEFYGYTLAYFILKEDGSIKTCKIIPRAHIEPIKGFLFPDIDNTSKKLKYAPLLDLGILFDIGDPKNIGLLSENLRYSFIKKYVIGDWARSAEKWTDPIISIQSDDDDDEMAKKEAFAKSFGNNSYIMGKTTDQINLIERKNGTGTHIVYKDLIDFCNDENSKGVNGQTGSSDQKAFVGAANVQERLLNDYTKARQQHIEFFHNEKTIPYLSEILNGGNTIYKSLKDYQFMFIEEEIEEIIEPPKGKSEGPQNSSRDFFI